MGCDIHAYIEYDDFKTREGDWYVSNFAHPSLGRNYTLFTLMAGVRYDPRFTDYEPMFEPRGLPSRLSWRCKEDYTLVVNDEHAAKGWERYCTTTDAARWGNHWFDQEHHLIAAPDWHSPSWLSIAELEAVKARYETILFYDESWFQFNPPSKQPVPEGAVVKELKRRWNFGLGDTEWFVGVGKQQTLPFPPTYEAVLAAMKVLERDEAKARFVFWFDN